MPRPKIKAELLSAASVGYDKLMTFIRTMTAEQRTACFAFADRDRNLRDVLAHLSQWHRMMQGWYNLGMAGQKPQIPGEGYTWQTLPALNQAIWEQAQTITLDQAIVDLEATHQAMAKLIEAHSDTELFTKKLYTWTGSTSLGAYLISSTSSHYDWALKKLRRASRAWLAD
ncbi:MAG: ClbS/DfsB family four-helix bundle protein [Micrococcales bacterium]|nr:ClbS/DfsB family four-helix bundle protein [Micrococcales bacterium]